jgi:hypothetical protein
MKVKIIAILALATAIAAVGAGWKWGHKKKVHSAAPLTYQQAGWTWDSPTTD